MGVLKPTSNGTLSAISNPSVSLHVPRRVPGLELFPGALRNDFVGPQDGMVVDQLTLQLRDHKSGEIAHGSRRWPPGALLAPGNSTRFTLGPVAKGVKCFG